MFKAGSNRRIELRQGWFVLVELGSSGRIDQLSKRGTLPKEQKSYLWVFKACNGIKERLRFLHSFASYAGAVLSVSDWRAQQLEAPVLASNETVGAVLGGYGTSLTRRWDVFEFGRVQAELD